PDGQVADPAPGRFPKVELPGAQVACDGDGEPNLATRVLQQCHEETERHPETLLDLVPPLGLRDLEVPDDDLVASIEAGAGQVVGGGGAHRSPRRRPRGEAIEVRVGAGPGALAQG